MAVATSKSAELLDLMSTQRALYGDEIFAWRQGRRFQAAVDLMCMTAASGDHHLVAGWHASKGSPQKLKLSAEKVVHKW